MDKLSLKPEPKIRQVEIQDFYKLCDKLANEVNKKIKSLKQGSSYPITIVPIPRNGLIPAQAISYRLEQRPKFFSLDPYLLEKNVNAVTESDRAMLHHINMLSQCTLKNHIVILVDTVFASGKTLGTINRFVRERNPHYVITASVYSFLPDSEWQPEIVASKLKSSNQDLWLSFPWE